MLNFEKTFIKKFLYNILITVAQIKLIVKFSQWFIVYVH